jgi:dCTP deaminase
LILSDRSIIERGIVLPLSPRTICPKSGNSYGVGPASYDVRLKQDILIWPKCNRLGSTVEHFELPADIAAVCLNKSSLIRRFVNVHATFGDPGWHGYLTIEISNHSWRFVRLHAGQPILQVLFLLLDRPAERPYGTGDKYQNQPDRPVPALFEVA